MHERLDVYKAAIDFLVIADEAIAPAFPKGRAYLADQLRRAATSIALNIAEGAGEFAAADKARFYRMARRSATECAAVLDVCGRLGLARRDPLLAGKAVLHRIVSMLTPLILKLSRTGTGTGKGSGHGESGSGKGTGTFTFTGGGETG